MSYSNQFEYKGKCPICERDMFDDGKSVNRHHFIPKSRGGKAQEFVHTLCHNTIHAIWTEKELEQEYSDPEKIKQHPNMEKFIQWVSKKDPLFYIKTKSSKQKRGR